MLLQLIIPRENYIAENNAQAEKKVPLQLCIYTLISPVEEKQDWD